ncbi:MAG: hypothetical protein M3069_23870 [Chloroflexota bacterium]|nr:hypothetical protein [Chloroflexota bacterium]
MERKLIEVTGRTREYDTGTSWHYSLIHTGRWFTQHILHYPDEGVYRMRIFHYPPRVAEEYAEEELWTFTDGTFATPDEAVAFGSGFVEARVAGG